MGDAQRTETTRPERLLRAAALAVLLAAGMAAPLYLSASSVQLPHSFQNGTLADAVQVNANFTALRDGVNDNNARLAQIEAGITVSTTNGTKVGIGTAVPNTALHVSGGEIQVSSSTGPAKIQLRDDGDGDIFSIQHLRVEDRFELLHLGTKLLVVTKAGRLGVGTIDPGGTLHVEGGVAAADLPGAPITLKAQDGGPDGIDTDQIGGKGGDIILLPGTGGGTPGGQAAGGKVGIGLANPTALLEVSDGTGPNATCDGNTWTNACSREAKEDIRAFDEQDYAGAGRWIEQTEVVWYRYKDAADPRPRVGLIAEEVPEVLASPDRKGISTADAIGVLTAALKAQQRRLDDLEARNVELRERVAELAKAGGR